MTPQEKAKELVDKYYDKLYYYLRYIYNEKEICLAAKQCSLIAVDEIINSGLLLDSSIYVQVRTSIEYWQQVKEEINKL